MHLLPPTPFLANGLEFGWRHSDSVGIGICIALAVLSILSWTVMLKKLSLLRKARQANAEFVAVMRSSPHPLSLFQTSEHFDFAPFDHIYHTAARELAYHLVGTDQPDRTFATRLQGAGRITPSQMDSVTVAMERAVAEAALKFERHMSIVAIALSGAPFIGLLGTVWGIMSSFAAIADAQGNATIQAMAPGVCAALLTTIVGLFVAIPSMFGYNMLINKIRAMIVRLENFASELCSTFDRHYVDHRAKAEELPSIGALASPNVVAFTSPRSMPPPSSRAVNE